MASDVSVIHCNRWRFCFSTFFTLHPLGNCAQLRVLPQLLRLHFTLDRQRESAWSTQPYQWVQYHVTWSPDLSQSILADKVGKMTFLILVYRLIPSSQCLCHFFTNFPRILPSCRKFVSNLCFLDSKRFFSPLAAAGGSHFASQAIVNRIDI